MELLGLYLGDGCISQLARTYSLRISLDSRYPGLIDDARRLLRRCFPRAGVFTTEVEGTRTVVVAVTCNHLPCLFPQHGNGKKHERPIVLEAWQQAHVDSAAWRFLRGLIRSDGCIFTNRTGRYEYLSSEFSDRSQDILGLFAATCDAVGVEYRRYSTRIRIYRRTSVARLTEHVGGKQ